MIDLTPIDVRKKKGDFRRSMRGYDAPVVDQFLDLVADRMEELTRSNATLADRVASLEHMVSDYKEREKALTEALVTAQEVREEVRKQAEQAADLLRREARADAEKLRRDAVLALEREDDALRELRARRGQFLRSYRRLLERELSELEVIDEELEREASDSRQRVEAVRAAAEEKSRRRWEMLEGEASGGAEDQQAVATPNGRPPHGADTDMEPAAATADEPAATAPASPEPGADGASKQEMFGIMLPPDDAEADEAEQVEQVEQVEQAQASVAPAGEPKEGPAPEAATRGDGADVDDDDEPEWLSSLMEERP